MPRGIYNRVKKWKWKDSSKKKLSNSKTGSKHTEETKKKMSEWHSGKVLTEETKGKISENNGNFWLGKKRSDETKEKMSKAQQGESSYRWNGGTTSEMQKIRDSKEYKKWRLEVYSKDDYTCQRCGKRGGKLNAHHIENFADNEELRLEPSNGIVFCEDCHKEFHKIYGFNKNSIEQLLLFIKQNEDIKN